MQKPAAALFLTFLLAACATPVTQRIQVSDVAAQQEARKQNIIALESLMADQSRLYRVAYPIWVQASALCGNATRFNMGTYITDLAAMPKELREAAATLYGLGSAPKVLYVVPGSSGDQAGIKPGDTLVALDDWKVPPGEGALRKSAEKFGELTKGGAPLKVTVLREGQPVTLPVTPDRMCAYGVALTPDDTVNAFADGSEVVVTTGMMRFAQNDTDLAVVVSHELAHDAMRHLEAKKQNYLLGSILDLIVAVATGANTQGTFGNIGAQAYSQEFEAEADYVGLYIMARAGLDIEQAPGFWRRLAALHPGSTRADYSSSHPSTAHRFLAMEETAKEIRKKQEAGLPLVPEMKQTAQTGSAAAEAATQAGVVQEPAKDVLNVALLGKEEKKVLLLSTLSIRMGFTNKSARTVAGFEGTVKFLDKSGAALGSLRVRYDKAVKPGETAELTETAYPLLFAGQFDKLKGTPTEQVELQFELTGIEFADGK